MSGSALCWWASIKRPLEKAQKMAKLLECKEAIAKDGSTDNKLLLQCFRGKSMEQLMNTHPNFYEWKHLEQVEYCETKETLHPGASPHS